MIQAVKIKNPFVSQRGENYHCFGCSPFNQFGLQLDFYAIDDMLYSEWLPKVEFEGYKNVVHGGIQSTIMDEIASWYVYVFLDTAGVTAKLSVDYLKPLAISSDPIRIEAYLKEKDDRFAKIEVKLINSSGVLCSTGEVEYFIFPSQVAKHRYNYPGKEAFK